MLSVERLNAFYGDSHILHDVSIQVGEGERVALLGRNGAGKTTLMKSLMNAGPTYQGSVQWRGQLLGSLAAYERARMGLCLVPEDRRILTHLTVLENLQLAARAVPRERGHADPEEILTADPILAPLGDRLGGRLSGGQQQMLAVARGLVQRPHLMLLDEPTEGLAPVIVEQLAETIVRSCQSFGTALLLCEQNLWFSRRCTDRLFLLDSGKIVFSGTWSEFDERPSLRTKHLAV